MLLRLACFVVTMALAAAAADPPVPQPPAEYTAEGYYVMQSENGFFRNLTFLEFYSTKAEVDKLYVHTTPVQHTCAPCIFIHLFMCAALRTSLTGAIVTPRKNTRRICSCSYNLLTMSCSTRRLMGNVGSSLGRSTTSGPSFQVHLRGGMRRTLSTAREDHKARHHPPTQGTLDKNTADTDA